MLVLDALGFEVGAARTPVAPKNELEEMATMATRVALARKSDRCGALI